jgi:hypothetical protein
MFSIDLFTCYVFLYKYIHLTSDHIQSKKIYLVVSMTFNFMLIYIVMFAWWHHVTQFFGSHCILFIYFIYLFFAYARKDMFVYIRLSSSSANCIYKMCAKWNLCEKAVVWNNLEWKGSCAKRPKFLSPLKMEKRSLIDLHVYCSWISLIILNTTQLCIYIIVHHWAPKNASLCFMHLFQLYSWVSNIY